MFRRALTITNDLLELSRVRDLVKAGVVSGGFPAQSLNRLQIAVDEAVTNIIEHGYAGVAPRTAKITVTVQVDSQDYRIVIEDQGTTFDPDQMAEVDIEAHVRAGRSGGLGVFLIRRIMDHIEYRYDVGKRNQLTMIKHRDSAAPTEKTD